MRDTTDQDEAKKSQEKEKLGPCAGIYTYSIREVIECRGIEVPNKICSE